MQNMAVTIVFSEQLHKNPHYIHCKLSSSFQKGQAPLSCYPSMSPSNSHITTLRTFPPEIREMIFNYSNVLNWTGKTPALLVALRGDREIYNEALEICHKNNTFKLHRGNEWKTGDMAIAALRSIRTLEIDFWYVMVI